LANKKQISRARQRTRIAALNRALQPAKSGSRRSDEDPRVNQAKAAWEHYQFEAATRLYEQALAADPTNILLTIDVARCYGLRRRFAESDRLLVQVLQRAMEMPRLYHVVAETHEVLGRYELAAATYLNGINLGVAPLESYARLANIYERLHQLDAAREALDRALAMKPSGDELRLLDVVLTRRQGERVAAESKVRALLADGPADERVHGKAWYELAHILDAQKDYDGAMAALLRAKEFARRRAGLALEHNKKMLAKNQEMLDTLTPEHFQRWSECSFDDAPRRLALLAGHPRSGTTMLEQVLRGHRELISLEERNVMAEEVYMMLGRKAGGNWPIPAMLDRAAQADVHAVRKTYIEHAEALLGEPLAGRMMLDKNPDLTMLIPTINRVFPEMKILIALRDPRDVCLSTFMMSVDINPVSVSYLSLQSTAAKYAMAMRTWLLIREMTRSPWLEVKYEEAVADLEGQARRVLEFLGLPWDDRVLEFHKLAREKPARSPTYEAVTRPVNSSAIGRWKNYARYFEPVLGTLDPLIRAFGYPRS
jgi:tetratricopeptide (TPR) repeat protein